MHQDVLSAHGLENKNKAPATGKETAKPSKKRRRRLLAALLLFAFIFLFRIPILRSIAGFLIVDEPWKQENTVLILNGDHCFDEAACKYLADHRTQILWISGRPGRLQAYGILPPFETTVKKELESRGVPQQALQILACGALNDWDTARCFRAWLDEHSSAQVGVLCNQFDSRRRHYVFASVLGRERLSKVCWHALPDRRYNENHWWQSRGGVIALFDSYVRLTHNRLSGEPEQVESKWNPDEYERLLRQNALP